MARISSDPIANYRGRIGKISYYIRECENARIWLAKVRLQGKFLIRRQPLHNGQSSED